MNLKNMKYVNSKLIAKYDLSNKEDLCEAAYLCVYEYEYMNKKYKYRMLCPDRITEIPEEMEVMFKNHPKDAVRAVYLHKDEERGIFIKIFSLIITLLEIISTAIYIYILFKYMMIDNLYGMIMLAFGIIIILFSIVKSKLPNKRTKMYAQLENSIINNSVAEAQLEKTSSNSLLYHGYKGKYKYSYQNTEYIKEFRFKNKPHQNIKIYFDNDTGKIIYFN